MSRFRLRRSSRYLRISPLHLEFHSPLQPSSQVVSGAVPRLSRGISHRTHLTACVPFKPSDSEQRSPPPSYRGCWHGVSRGFLRGLGQERMMLALSPILPPNRSLQPEAFILHAASLHQTFVHCARFSTAASRRSLGSVSVPVCGNTLSGPVRVLALVSHYLTNKLIRPRPLDERQVPFEDPRLSSHTRRYWERIRN